MASSSTEAAAPVPVEAAAATTTATTTTTPTAIADITAADVAEMPFPDLEDRKTIIDKRLDEITIEEPAILNKASRGSSGGGGGNKKAAAASKSNNTTSAIASGIPYNPKTDDTHWDFCLKEMMWLGADFQAERKRQKSLAKKCCLGIKQYHKTKEARRLRELSQAEMKRRKLAAKLGRETQKAWWTKIEKIIAYKQKLLAEEERKKAMNKQLVTLVQQTEKYSELLAASQTEDEDTDYDDEDDDSIDDETSGMDESEDADGASSIDSNNNKKRHRRRKKKHHRLTIEEALAADTAQRRSKSRVIDYSRLRLEKSDSVFYGESTASDGSGTGNSDDGSFSPESDMSSDDETTLKQAMQDELLERKRSKEVPPESNTFLPDPEELRKLREEQEMKVEEILQRLQEEADKAAAATAEETEQEEAKVGDKVTDSTANTAKPMDVDDDDDDKPQKKVQFSESVNKPKKEQEDPGNDADDDGDASDVEDYKERIGDAEDDANSDQEFEAQEPEADDETTMIQEESLPQEMSREQEIDLLKQESEMSIEELRARYAQLEAEHEKNGDNDEFMDVDDEEEESPSQPKKKEEPTATQKETSAEQVKDEEGANKALEVANVPSDAVVSSELVRDKAEEPEAAKVPSDDARTTRSKRVRKSLDDKKPDATKSDLIATDQKKPDAAKSDSLATEQGQTPDIAKSDAAGSLSSLAGPLMDSDVDGGAEYQPDEMEGIDDETTIEAEEKLGRDMSYKQEIDLLQQESEIPVEQLRAMYAKMQQIDEEESGDDEPSSSNPSAQPEISASDSGPNPAAAASTSTTAAILTRLEESEEDAEEFKFNAAEAVDDETTIEIEEKMGREMTYEEEMEMLKKENEIPVEKLREMYGFLSSNKQDDEDDVTDGGESEPADVASVNDEAVSSTTHALLGAMEQSDIDAEEFQPDESELVDDETTMEAEERLGRDMSYEDEIAMLNRENEMSVEELRKMYAGMESTEAESAASGSDAAKMEEGSMEIDEDSESSSRAKQGSKRQRGLDQPDSSRPSKSSRASTGDVSDDGQTALDALEASAERARQTLATRPYILAGWVKLRRYQQIGLNWLVSMQSRRLNGILADEMGLGKTLQTISLLAYLASFKGIWGPHLVVVPTSVIINWETELKRFCPALKVLCYYGSAKRRKELRTGWTKTNWYHVVITSYQLAVQDAFAFKRKKWYYLILDEAQNIKNFQSQRWQTLINFNTQRRLLLTGTPLQNNLMELWSLLHFLMPYIFRSRKEFSYWFSNPMNNIIEGNADRNDDVIRRLHGIIRPFVLRRLKKDVETQMPGKYEHIVKCQLSRRQMTLYEEFLSRSSTRQALTKGGNFMGMMNVLMQLRKVCNHPDLFEPRSVVTPFVAPALAYDAPSCIYDSVFIKPVIDCLSANLLHPLWCGSSGVPSVATALRHGQTEAEQLRRLRATYDNTSLVEREKDENSDCPDELRELFNQVLDMRRQEKADKAIFHDNTNTWRCQTTAFPYADDMQDLVRTEISVFEREEPVELSRRQVLLTPSQLLGMRKTERRRAQDMEAIIEKYVFCVPRAGAKAPAFSGAGSGKLSPVSTTDLEDMLLEPLEDYFRPFRRAHARLSSFFPDKKLVQYDAGKLQTLAELLHELKRGGHRVLIFTQMSKMLDILEAFLNINGHTYLRLDGATGVERRQRYMDRFNNDTKIFSFILSTRSGGMGINLTGADTVIFFDSDWNPAMDAQAQDRAHRIGQTRDVHIYRLITEHTIEENILMKAKQKRNLDIMVMDQGKFDASQLTSKESIASEDTVKDVLTKGGLRAILGVTDDEKDQEVGENEESSNKDTGDVSKEQMEQAMAELEDEDDVKALRGAQREAAEEAKEFDETAEIVKDDEGDEDEEGDETSSRPAKKQKTKKNDKEKEKKADQQGGESGDKNEETDLEKEFAAWQSSVGLDAAAIESTLSPLERYGIRFREEVDPFYSIFAINEQQRKLDATEEAEEIDITEIEREKAAEEQAAMDEGDLLATYTRPEDLVRQRNLYRREKARLRAEKKRRKLTGEEWSSRIDGLSKKPFWYNTDTGEAVWDKPIVLLELEAHNLAEQNGWVATPHKPLVKIMEFLIPFPQRQTCALVCRQWKAAAQDIRFVRHVYPVEMGALSIDASRREPNHYGTIDEALAASHPGDTIELSDGHYWVNDPGLLFDKPLQLIGDEKNPANVVVEMSGSVRWSANGGWIEGVTFRRPKISTELPSYPMLDITGKGRINLFHCVFDNEGSTGSVVLLSGTGHKGNWRDATIRNGGSCGIEMQGEITFQMNECCIRGNKSNGMQCKEKARFTLQKCKVERNGGHGVKCDGSCSGAMQKNHFSKNFAGVLSKGTGCFISCNHNTAIVEAPPKKTIPGFKLTHVIESEGGVAAP